MPPFWSRFEFLSKENLVRHWLNVPSPRSGRGRG
jgi:hypothetical protein